MEDLRRDNASVGDIIPLSTLDLPLEAIRLCCDFKYSSTKLLLSLSGGKRGAREGLKMPEEARRGARFLLPLRNEVMALRETWRQHGSL